VNLRKTVSCFKTENTRERSEVKSQGDIRMNILELVDFHKLNEDIKQILISARYDEMYPIDLFNVTYAEVNQRPVRAVQMYQSDTVAHARIDTMTAGILYAVEQIIKAAPEELANVVKDEARIIRDASERRKK